MTLVFLSYASEDDWREDENSRGWVTALDQLLKHKLRRIRGAELWRDKRDFHLPGPVRDRLSEEIAKADFLLPVLSTDYNLKEYTRHELTEFFNLVRARTRDLHRDAKDARDFIIPVLPRPLPEDEYFPPLSGTLHVEFFRINDAGRATPFFRGLGRETSDEFHDKVEEIVTLIEECIREKQKARATVYLAEADDDQISNYWSVINELKSQKCSVMPKPKWPVNPPDARSFMSKALEEAQFSVHLLGTTAGPARAGLTNLSALQLDMAAERQKRDEEFRRLIWIPPDVQPADPVQRELIEGFHRGERLTDRDELVLHKGIEVFKNTIHEELARADKSPDARP